MQIFRNRRDAGKALAAALGHYANRDDVVVLGLPRGGVPVAFEVALALNAPLDVFIVRKLGLPGNEEYAMGAIASGEVLVMNPDAEYFHVASELRDAVIARERGELHRRELEYRGTFAGPDVAGKTVILVDDGLATGTSMRAAADALRMHAPSRIVVAVPVAAASTCRSFLSIVDEVICLIQPEHFQAVGLWYEDFSQTSDEEVRSLLQAAHPREVES